MKAFTDDEMTALLPTAKAYSVVILKQGRPQFRGRHGAGGHLGARPP
jgi:hypothetical protein